MKGYRRPLEVSSGVRSTVGAAMALKRIASRLDRLVCRGRTSPPSVVRRPVCFITGKV